MLILLDVMLFLLSSSDFGSHHVVRSSLALAINGLTFIAIIRLLCRPYVELFESLTINLYKANCFQFSTAMQTQFEVPQMLV